MMSVPLWRTKTEPFLALEPGTSLIPRYFGLESRPFLETPADFLCAMNVILYGKMITEVISFDKDGRAESVGVFKKLFLSLVIILVATFSFSLGRLSNTGQGSEAIQIEYDPSLITDNQTSQTASAVNSISDNSVIASRNGKKYHFLHCNSAKSIKEENKITFPTREAAEASGYTLASNCKPR